MNLFNCKAMEIHTIKKYLVLNIIGCYIIHINDHFSKSKVCSNNENSRHNNRMIHTRVDNFHFP